MARTLSVPRGEPNGVPNYIAILYCWIIGALTIALSGCGWVGIAIKEGAIQASEHRGRDSFTVKGKLPAGLDIRATAYYAPSNVTGTNCQEEEILSGNKIPRKKQETHKNEFKSPERNFTFEVPTKYFAGLCAMNILQMTVEIIASPERRIQRNFRSVSDFYIVDSLPDNAHAFPDNGELLVKFECYGPQAKTQPEQHHYNYLNCLFANIFLPYKELPGKSIKLTIDSQVDFLHAASINRYSSDDKTGTERHD